MTSPNELDDISILHTHISQPLKPQENKSILGNLFRKEVSTPLEKAQSTVEPLIDALTFGSDRKKVTLGMIIHEMKRVLSQPFMFHDFVGRLEDTIDALPSEQIQGVGHVRDQLVKTLNESISQSFPPDTSQLDLDSLPGKIFTRLRQVQEDRKQTYTEQKSFRKIGDVKEAYQIIRSVLANPERHHEEFTRKSVLRNLSKALLYRPPDIAQIPYASFQLVLEYLGLTELDLLPNLKKQLKESSDRQDLTQNYPRFRDYAQKIIQDAYEHFAKQPPEQLAFLLNIEWGTTQIAHLDACAKLQRALHGIFDADTTQMSIFLTGKPILDTTEAEESAGLLHITLDQLETLFERGFLTQQS